MKETNNLLVTEIDFLRRSASISRVDKVRNTRMR